MFREGIIKLIERYQGKMVVINRLTPLCLCAKSISGEPNEICGYCFGTGNQVVVKEIYGVIQDSNGTTTMRKAADYTITKEIFMDAKYSIKPEDLLVFEGEVWKAYQVKTHRLTNNDPVYHIVYATPLKQDSAFIIQKLLEMGVVKC